MILKHVGITQKTIHYLRHGYIPDPLLATMRVMAMNPAEVDICYELADQEELNFKDPTISDTNLDGDSSRSDSNRETVAGLLTFLSVRNELAMLDLLDMLMGTKLQGILEWDTKLTLPQNQAQEFAHIYREGKSMALWPAKSHCRGWPKGLTQSMLDVASSTNMVSVSRIYRTKADSAVLFRYCTGYDVKVVAGTVLGSIGPGASHLCENTGCIQPAITVHGGLYPRDVPGLRCKRNKDHDRTEKRCCLTGSSNCEGNNA